MICVTFREREGVLYGFTVQGHAGAAAAGHDIVCAAVSSAAYMAANTLTEICRCGAVAEALDGFTQVTVQDGGVSRDILAGLHLHLSQLQLQYPQRIAIEITEV